MAEIAYQIVEHDGGWAYKVGATYSETFKTREEAMWAAQRAADEQQVGGETQGIVYEDQKGEWHNELSRGDDRPTTRVDE